MIHEHLSMFDLDAFALGGEPGAAADALSPEGRRRAQAHLAACARCRADLDETRAAAEIFRARVMPRTMAGLAGRTAAPWGGWRLALGAAAGLALALLIIRPPGRPSSQAPAASSESTPRQAIQLGTKGGPLLRVFARDGASGRVYAVTDGAALAAGDVLRFTVEPAGLPYLLLASVDGEGKVSVYYPFGGAGSGPVSAGEPAAGWELPDSIRLDDARGPERLVALFSRSPLSSAAVRKPLLELGSRGAAAIREARRNPLPDLGAAQVTFLIEKRR